MTRPPLPPQARPASRTRSALPVCSQSAAAATASWQPSFSSPVQLFAVWFLCVCVMVLVAACLAQRHRRVSSLLWAPAAASQPGAPPRFVCSSLEDSALLLWLISIISASAAPLDRGVIQPGGAVIQPGGGRLFSLEATLGSRSWWNRWGRKLTPQTRCSSCCLYLYIVFRCC